MTELTAPISKAHTRSRFHFARHLVEMFVSMMAGMMVGAFLFALALGTSVPDARREHAIAWIVVMALDMTIPMVGVMLWRGHSRRSAAEMAAAMVVPALPIVGLQLGHVGGNVGGAYMGLSTLAMIALIVYRRDEYRAAAGGHR
jgi:hypothetical protein